MTGMKHAILQQFPSGEWSWGWATLILFCFAAVLAVAISLNVRDGHRWNGEKVNDPPPKTEI